MTEHAKQRLLTSKQAFEAKQEQAGFEDGWHWTAVTAEYEALRQLYLCVEPVDSKLMDAVYPETFQEFERMAGVAVDWPTRSTQEPHYLKGFIRGALAGFEEFFGGI